MVFIFWLFFPLLVYCFILVNCLGFIAPLHGCNQTLCCTYFRHWESSTSSPRLVQWLDYRQIILLVDRISLFWFWCSEGKVVVKHTLAKIIHNCWVWGIQSRYQRWSLVLFCLRFFKKVFVKHFLSASWQSQSS